MVTVHIEDDLAALIGREHELVEQAAQELVVMELYRRGSISSGKAAQLLGMERADFITHSSRLGIPIVNMSKEEVEAEVARIRARCNG